MQSPLCAFSTCPHPSVSTETCLWGLWWCAQPVGEESRGVLEGAALTLKPPVSCHLLSPAKVN